eukprot:2777496-Rhodomonas_salina.1
MTGCTGTKRYMAPEVVLSRPNYDEKVRGFDEGCKHEDAAAAGPEVSLEGVDVYSMAMIFYYMVVGERPFEHTDPELISVLAATRGLRPEAAKMRWPDMKELVEMMWEEEPEKRPTAWQLVQKLGPLKPPDTKPGFSCSVICTASANYCSVQ